MVFKKNPFLMQFSKLIFVNSKKMFKNDSKRMFNFFFSEHFVFVDYFCHIT